MTADKADSTHTVEGLLEQVEGLQRHNDRLHRRIRDTLPSDYDALKGEQRKAWEKVKNAQRQIGLRDAQIANLEGKVERQSARIDRAEAERDHFRAALEEIVTLHSGLPVTCVEIAKRALNGSSTKVSEDG